MLRFLALSLLALAPGIYAHPPHEEAANIPGVRPVALGCKEPLKTLNSAISALLPESMKKSAPLEPPSEEAIRIYKPSYDEVLTKNKSLKDLGEDWTLAQKLFSSPKAVPFLVQRLTADFLDKPLDSNHEGRNALRLASIVQQSLKPHARGDDLGTRRSVVDLLVRIAIETPVRSRQTALAALEECDPVLVQRAVQNYTLRANSDAGQIAKLRDAYVASGSSSSSAATALADRGTPQRDSLDAYWNAVPKTVDATTLYSQFEKSESLGSWQFKDGKVQDVRGRTREHLLADSAPWRIAFLNDYENKVVAELKGAMTEGRPDKLASVARRAFFSPLGIEASLTLGAFYLQDGNPLLAGTYLDDAHRTLDKLLPRVQGEKKKKLEAMNAQVRMLSAVMYRQLKMTAHAEAIEREFLGATFGTLPVDKDSFAKMVACIPGDPLVAVERYFQEARGNSSYGAVRDALQTNPEFLLSVLKHLNPITSAVADRSKLFPEVKFVNEQEAEKALLSLVRTNFRESDARLLAERYGLGEYAKTPSAMISKALFENAKHRSKMIQTLREANVDISFLVPDMVRAYDRNIAGSGSEAERADLTDLLGSSGKEGLKELVRLAQRTPYGAEILTWMRLRVLSRDLESLEPELRKLYARDRPEQVRLAAFELIVRVGNDGSLLLEALKDPDTRIVKRALDRMTLDSMLSAEHLKRLKRDDFAEEILRLEKNPDIGLGALVEASKLLGNKKLEGLFLRELDRKGGDPFQNAIAGLELIGEWSPAALDRIATLARGDYTLSSEYAYRILAKANGPHLETVHKALNQENAKARASAARALAVSEDPKTIRALQQSVKHDHDESARVGALRSLETIHKKLKKDDDHLSFLVSELEKGKDLGKKKDIVEAILDYGLKAKPMLPALKRAASQLHPGAPGVEGVMKAIEGLERSSGPK